MGRDLHVVSHDCGVEVRNWMAATVRNLCKRIDLLELKLADIHGGDYTAPLASTTSETTSPGRQFIYLDKLVLPHSSLHDSAPLCPRKFLNPDAAVFFPDSVLADVVVVGDAIPDSSTVCHDMLRESGHDVLGIQQFSSRTDLPGATNSAKRTGNPPAGVSFQAPRAVAALDVAVALSPQAQAANENMRIDESTSFYWFFDPDDWKQVRGVSTHHKFIAELAIDNLADECSSRDSDETLANQTVGEASSDEGAGLLWRRASQRALSDLAQLAHSDGLDMPQLLGDVAQAALQQLEGDSANSKMKDFVLEIAARMIFSHWEKRRLWSLLQDNYFQIVEYLAEDVAEMVHDLEMDTETS